MRLAVILLLLLPATASARWTTYTVARDSTDYSPILASDGDRWAIAAGEGSSLRVFDDRHPERGWRDLAYGPECRRTRAVGAGRAALVCTTGYTPAFPHLLDLRTGVLTRVPGALADPYDVQLDPVALGRRWLGVIQSAYHVFLVSHLSLADGRLVEVDAPRRTADLDAVDVARPLCAPVRRPPTVTFYDLRQPRYQPVQRTGRWVVFTDGHDERITALKAWRCGKPRPRRLLSCGIECDQFFGTAQTGAGLVTVRRKRRLLVFDLRRHRRRALSLAGAPADPQVVHTRRFLFAAGAGSTTVTVAYRRLP